MKTREELIKLNIVRLKALAKELELDVTFMKKNEIIATLLKQYKELEPVSEFIGVDDEPVSEFIAIEEEEPMSEFLGDNTPGEYEQSIFLGNDTTDRKPDPLRLQTGDQILLKNIKYTILNVISEHSLEAVIYKAENEKAEIVVLKIYHATSGREPNQTALEKIKAIEDPDILNLFDFGTGDEKYEGKHCFEISAFAEGGDLLASFTKKYSPEFLKEEVIPQVFKGVRRLHKEGIVHCDLKPGNIFYLDKENTDLVIGDYGSAKTTGHTEEMEMVSQVIGTKHYMPSEQGQLVVSEKNDYYSFGMILLHLFYPEHLCRDDDPTRVDNKKYNQIVLRGYNAKGGLIDFDSRYAELNRLIAGLTRKNPAERWGEQQVERWMRGEVFKEQYEKKGIQIKLGAYTVNNHHDLIQVLKDFEDWYEYLIDDDQGFKLLLSWTADHFDLGRKRELEQMVSDLKPLGEQYVKEGLHRLMDPLKPILVGSIEFDLLRRSTLQKSSEDFFEHIDKLWKHTAEDEMLFWLFQYEMMLRHAAVTGSEKDRQTALSILEKLAESTRLAKSHPSMLNADYKSDTPIHRQLKNGRHIYFCLISMFWFFNKNRPFKTKNYEEIHDLEGLGLHIAKIPVNLKLPYQELEKNFFLKAKGRAKWKNLEHKDLVFRIFSKNVNVRLQLNKVALQSSNRSFNIHYQLFRSLSRHFKSLGLSKTYEEEKPAGQKVNVKEKADLGAEQAQDLFFQQVKEKHELPEELFEKKNLEETLIAMQKKFPSQKSSLYVQEALASLILLLPALAMLMIVIPENWMSGMYVESLHADDLLTFDLGLMGLSIPYLILSYLPRIWQKSWMEDFEAEVLVWYLVASGVMPILYCMANNTYVVAGILGLGFVAFKAFQRFEKKSSNIMGLIAYTLMANAVGRLILFVGGWWNWHFTLDVISLLGFFGVAVYWFVFQNVKEKYDLRVIPLYFIPVLFIFLITILV